MEIAYRFRIVRFDRKKLNDSSAFDVAMKATGSEEMEA